ncbi:MAG TPA: hypothetical protein VFJ83_03500 [Nocardioidaceae bacterium]|nr:hypothetical protein [Nocardioidaceae bacterium]
MATLVAGLFLTAVLVDAALPAVVAAVFFTAVFLAPDVALVFVDFAAVFAPGVFVAGGVLAGVFAATLVALTGAFFVAFFAGGFVLVFEVLVFLVVDVLVVGVFLAEVFVAGAFLAEVLVAGAFVAADFLAGAFFAAAFLALDDAGFAAADLVVEAVPFAVDVFVAVVLVDLRATLEVTLLAAAAVLPASFFAVDRAMAPGPPIQPGCVAITTRVRRGYAFTVEASNKSATKTDVSVSHPVWQT